MSGLHVLVVGASGFIGRSLVAALLARGHIVTCAGREPDGLRRRFPSCPIVAADFMVDSAADWATRLVGIDAVVNAAGALRGRLDTVHATGPCALFDACAALAIPRVVQLSALGAGDQPESRFLVTKDIADRHLLRLAAQGARAGWHVVKPSFVIGRGGASTALFCALAACPRPVRLASGSWRLQPVHIRDLTQALVDLLENPSAAPIVAIAGPGVMTTDELTCRLRDWLGLAPATTIILPHWLLSAGAQAGDHLARSMLTRESLAMLAAGNVVPASCAMIVSTPITDALAADPASGAELLQARLSLVKPFIAAALIAVWVGTGIASFHVTASQAATLLAPLAVPKLLAAPITQAGAVLDLTLGLLLFSRWRRPILRAQLAAMVAYTVLATVAQPALWADPFGPLLKNMAVAAATLTLLAMVD